MIPIPIPKEMVNDDAYLVVALLAESGSRVGAGQALAELESSKSTFILYSPAGGFFLPDFAAGQMAPVNATFGVIANEIIAGGKTPAAASQSASDRDRRFSLPAWELFVTSGLPAKRFAEMNHVRRSDVETALEENKKSGEAGTEGSPTLAELAAYSDYEKRNAVIMLGGGGHCRECIDIVELVGEYRIAGVIDTKSAPGADVGGYPVIGGNEVLEELRRVGIRNLILAYGISGDHVARGRFFAELLGLSHVFPAITHPKAAVNRCAVLGRGVHIMAGARIGSEAKIGEACIINSNSVVSHDCDLGANVHVAPGAIIAGGVKIGRDSVIGMGSTVYMRVRIGEGVVVYNGAHVFADVPDGMIVKSEWTG